MMPVVLTLTVVTILWTRRVIRPWRNTPSWEFAVAAVLIIALFSSALHLMIGVL